ncbi:MAG: metallophosphoesterase [Spirochaetaceae bacterium]|nr:metallophosphoesterase [Spirochaetaceae bacterium]
MLAVMIYITGDTHGGIDMAKLDDTHFRGQFALTKEDYLIIAGDFGFIWQNNDKEREWLEIFEKLPYTTLFIDGNHENFELLNSYPEDEWQGGMIHRINDSLFHLMRGQVFEIEEKRFFTFGGGRSLDRAFRRPQISWWPEEMPSAAEFQEGLDNLERCQWKTDYVITHAGPAKIASGVSALFGTDSLVTYLQAVADRLEFRRWYFGHYHVDREINSKFRALYQDVVPLGG